MVLPNVDKSGLKWWPRSEYLAEQPARKTRHYPMVGIENSAPSLMPEGQRDVMVFVRV